MVIPARQKPNLPNPKFDNGYPTRVDDQDGIFELRLKFGDEFPVFRCIHAWLGSAKEPGPQRVTVFAMVGQENSSGTCRLIAGRLDQVAPVRPSIGMRARSNATPGTTIVVMSAVSR